MKWDVMGKAIRMSEKSLMSGVGAKHSASDRLE